MLLLESIALSVIIWGFLFGLKFAIVLITAIFIHEYGHFYWMGKEGIKDKDMIFLPPVGAVARSKEYWPSYGAELRIALAGPTFGLLSVALFWILYLLYSKDIFLASIALACIINLFNLAIPIAILDGGRVIKSILYSLRQSLGDAFYIFGFGLMAFAFVLGYISILFVLLIGFFLYAEYSSVGYHRSALKTLHLKKKAFEILDGGPFASEETAKDLVESIDKEISKLDAVVNLKKMNTKEMISGFLFFLVLIGIYVAALYHITRIMGIRIPEMLSYFE